MCQVVYSVRSSRKIVHMTNCSVIQRIDKKNRRTFDSLEEAREKGYRLCSCCPSIAQKYRKERKAVRDYCCDHGFTVFLSDGALHVLSELDSWCIITVGKNKKLLLYHMNTLCGKNEESLVPGYHLQKCTRRTIMDYMTYIQEHDEYRRANPLVTGKRSSDRMAGKQVDAWVLDKYQEFAPIIQESSKPRKGTKRYRKAEKRRKIKERRAQVRRVYELIEQLSCAGA